MKDNKFFSRLSRSRRLITPDMETQEAVFRLLGYRFPKKKNTKREKK